MINRQQARILGKEIAGLIQQGQNEQAFQVIYPVLSERISFSKLEEIGKPIGMVQFPGHQQFLERVASQKTEGGWVVIASALRENLHDDFFRPFMQAHGYSIAADVWYAADIFGERVPGPALLIDFERALQQLEPWRFDNNRWVRRTVGVAVHFWAKRSRFIPESHCEAGKLLEFLEPLFSENNMDAVKGIGWGLKTLGRYYPEILTSWLRQMVLVEQRPHRTLMLRKALTFIPIDQQTEFIK